MTQVYIHYLLNVGVNKIDIYYALSRKRKTTHFRHDDPVTRPLSGILAFLREIHRPHPSQRQVSRSLNVLFDVSSNNPDTKVHGVHMPIWGRQDPGGSHVGTMNFAIWEAIVIISDGIRLMWRHDNGPLRRWKISPLRYLTLALNEPVAGLSTLHSATF